MEKYYTINEISIMTGLTTRTIRNYLKSGLINAEKINGIWMFSHVDFSDMLANPAIKPSIQAKNNAVVYDFLVDNKKKINKTCTIIDLYIDDTESNETSEFFCNTINSLSETGELSFKFEKNGRNVRVILSGTEETVIDILNKYYNR
mgnify:FL=1